MNYRRIPELVASRDGRPGDYTEGGWIRGGTGQSSESAMARSSSASEPWRDAVGGDGFGAGVEDTFIACYLPARRASLVDPIEALRAE